MDFIRKPYITKICYRYDFVPMMEWIPYKNTILINNNAFYYFYIKEFTICARLH